MEVNAHADYSDEMALGVDSVKEKTLPSANDRDQHVDPPP